MDKHTVFNICNEVLWHYLKPRAAVEIWTRPISRLNDRTMLDLLEEGRSMELIEYVGSMFNYESANGS